METFHIPPTDASLPDAEAAKNTICSHHASRHRWFLFLVVAAFFGFAGGLLSPFALRFYDRQMAAFGIAEKKVSLQPSVRTDSILEDTLTTDLIEKNAAGVVSIVITRDVPKVRNFFNSPFGNNLPFFFGPQGGNEVPGGDNGGETERQQVGSGSGFFVSSDGLIVTNKHVVSDLRADYTVITSSGEEHPATVLARDPNNDIAILKIEGNDFPALALGDSDAVRVGQTVLAIGNPLGEFANSVSRGIISGVKRNVSAGSGSGMAEQLTDIIQTDAAINPGNSGGPLFDLSGNVIGVNVAMAQGAENIGFALPINQVKRVADQVRETGKITTPYIGMRYIILNEDIQKQNNLDFNYGALILRGQNITDFAVIPGSPADKAGLVENDIILEINGEKIDEDYPLGNAISQYNVGDEIALKIWHKGAIKEVKVKLEERK